MGYGGLGLARHKTVGAAIDRLQAGLLRVRSTLESTRLFRHVNIQTNDACTRACSFCYHGLPAARRQPAARMSEATFAKIIGELAALDYTGRLSLYEINEPLTDGRIFDFLRLAVERLPRAWHVLTSNGDLLTPSVARQLCEIGVDELHVSVYDEATGRKVAAVRAALPPAMADRVRPRSLIGGPGHLLENRAGWVGAADTAAARARATRPCQRVRERLYVRPDGRVVSCMCDFAAVNVMGDATHSSLLDIWYGAPFATLRAALNRGDRAASPLCARCDYRGYGSGFAAPPRLLRRSRRILAP